MKQFVSVLMGACLLAGPGIALADGQTGSSDTPSGNSEISTLYNPTVTCAVQPGDSMADVLSCLASAIEMLPPAPCEITSAGNVGGRGGVDISQNPRDCSNGTSSASDFESWVDVDGQTLHVRKRVADLQGIDDPDRLVFIENDTGLKRVWVQVERADHVARILAIDVEPAGDGHVAVYLNVDKATGEPILVAMVPTNQFSTRIEINLELQRQFLDAGYDVASSLGYYLVGNGLTHQVADVWRIEYEATDSNLVRSDIAIVEAADVEWGLAVPGKTPPLIP